MVEGPVCWGSTLWHKGQHSRGPEQLGTGQPRILVLTLPLINQENNIHLTEQVSSNRWSPLMPFLPTLLQGIIWGHLRPTWLCIPGCVALGEWSHHCDYLGHEDLFCIVSFCTVSLGKWILGSQVSRAWTSREGAMTNSMGGERWVRTLWSAGSPLVPV